MVYAICRQVAEAKLYKKEYIKIIGDGYQTRSFLYIDDCLDAILKMTRSNIVGPLNIGSAEMVSINELVSIIMDIAVYHPKIFHREGPTGAVGRTSDNHLIERTLNWKPKVRLVDGLVETYEWVLQQVHFHRKSTGVYREKAEVFKLDESEGEEQEFAQLGVAPIRQPI